MTQSTIQPDEIYIDKIRNGRTKILVRWNIQEQDVIDEMTDETTTIYEYQEHVMWWTFPLEENGLILDNRSNIEQYLQNHKSEILNFAKGAKVTL